MVSVKAVLQKPKKTGQRQIIDDANIRNTEAKIILIKNSKKKK